MDGYAAMMPWGRFSGGALVLPELGIKIPYKPGDVLLIRSALLEHYLTDFDGERTSTIFFLHKDVDHQPMAEARNKGILSHAPDRSSQKRRRVSNYKSTTSSTQPS